MVQFAERVALRAAEPGDQSYVTSTWALQICRGRNVCRGHGVACGAARAVVDRLVDRPDVVVTIAAHPEHADVIAGWIAVTPLHAARLLHMVYVRHHLRGRGIARQLADRAWDGAKGPIVYTMRGDTADALVRCHPAAIHHPLQEFLA